MRIGLGGGLGGWKGEIREKEGKTNLYKESLFYLCEMIFEIIDNFGKKIHLSKERWKHILRHPKMHDQIENIKETLKNPGAIRYYEDDEKVRYFYKEFKNNDTSERYLLVSVKYLNGKGFIITSFFTNKITGLKWKTI